jgi:N-acetylmuramoyl-L-alanine amidase
MKIEGNKFTVEPGSGIAYRFIPSPNVHAMGQAKTGRTLVIHTTEGPSVDAAIGIFQQKSVPGDIHSGLSIHLVLGRDGKDLVQMVPFDRGAIHASAYNSKSIGIEVDYPGDLREQGVDYRLRSHYRPEQYILASPFNDPRFRYWPLFPRQQLDTLVEISRPLLETYQIQDIAGHEELYAYKLDPGPAFPMVQFREQLGIHGRSVVLQETAKPVRVRNQPGDGSVLLEEPAIPAGTPVTIVNDYNDPQGRSYCLISVVDTIEGNPWILGWVEREAVTVRLDQEFLVTDDQFLATPDGRHFQVVQPHPNGYDHNPQHLIDDHKYIIIHFTTGTRIESTIAYFRTESAGVSAHLLIARDGRVVQFLPFNRIAYHAGYSWWERDTNLNRYSIGIELDNAGTVAGTPGNWVRKDRRIPDEDVELKRYWRDMSPEPKAWQKFTPIQLDVLEKILHALAAHYGGPDHLEILGHDEVNLANRVDPGPLFPMEDMRERVLGRRQPSFLVFHLAKEGARLYTNESNNVPDPKLLQSAVSLPRGAEVLVQRVEERWSLVTVLNSKSGAKPRGWILSNLLADPGKGGKKQGGKKGAKPGNKKVKPGKPEPVRKVTKSTQWIYPKFQAPPAIEVKLPKFTEDQRIRIQEVRDSWSLVVMLDYFGKQGWVETRCISPEPGTL